jgi:hypothetical protein
VGDPGVISRACKHYFSCSSCKPVSQIAINVINTNDNLCLASLLNHDYGVKKDTFDISDKLSMSSLKQNNKGEIFIYNYSYRYHLNVFQLFHQWKQRYIPTIGINLDIIQIKFEPTRLLLMPQPNQLIARLTHQ